MEFETVSSQPAASDRAIIFCCDKKYLPYAMFSAAQIAELSPGRDFDICVCCDTKVEAPHSLDSLNIRFCTVETGDAFSSLETDYRRTQSAFVRLALPQIFENEYRRILYLDSDIFVQGGSFGALFNAELGPHPVGAVRDHIQWRTPRRMPGAFRAFGLANDKYFNSGVLLIDCQAYIAQDILAKARAYGDTGKTAPFGHDQPMLNCALHSNWAELSPVWNWQFTKASSMMTDLIGANVVHFIGARKPWKDAERHLPLRFADGLGRFLANHMPNIEFSARDTSRLPDRTLMRKTVITHLRALRRFNRYMAKFPDELTVVR